MISKLACHAFVLAAAAPALAAPANPTVVGPIPQRVAPGDPSHDYVFFTPDLDLRAQGFIEEEFFLEGTATRFVGLPPSATAPQPLTTAVPQDTHPYRTRIVVRRPQRARDFNGTVLVEWVNVTPGNDLNAHWNASFEHIIAQGYVWVGVSAQRVGVHQPVTGLRAWSPVRYGTLDLTDGGTVLDDSLAFDVFSQAAQAVAHPRRGDVKPLGPLRAQRMIAIGASQSASSRGLTTYHNSVQPLHGVFDAFMLLVGGGELRTDLDVKVLKILSETELAGAAQIALRAKDVDTGKFRRWEVAGTAHSGFRARSITTPLQLRDGLAPSPENCEQPPFSKMPNQFVINAGYDALDRWLRFGIAPSRAPQIELDPANAIVRDGLGLARGGIRLSQQEVPTALNNGINGGPVFCRLFGTHVPFDQATLDRLYPSHGRYVQDVLRVTTHNLGRGFISFADALRTLDEAVRSDVGR